MPRLRYRNNLRPPPPQQMQNAGIVAGGCYQQALGVIGNEQQGLAGLAQQRVPLEVRRRAHEAYYTWERGLWIEYRGEPEHPYLEALQRSEALLERHLTDEQASQLRRWGWFEVVGKVKHLVRSTTHRFRIHEHCVVYEHKPDGRMHYCIIALEPGLPEPDWMLAVKLFIEGDCDRFLRTAKRRGWQPVQ